MRCNRCPDSADYTRDELVAHFLETGHPACIICRSSLHGHEPQTCSPCVARARTTLADVAELYDELPDNLDRPSPSRHQHPGGDPLVMLAWGSEGAFWRGQTHLPVGNDNWPTDPPSVAFALARWEDEWRTLRGEPAPTQPPTSKSKPASRVNQTMRAAVHYQQRNLQWAANQHPAFDEYATDLRALRRTLQNATTHHDRPEHGAPCFHCHEPLERAWEDPSVCRHERPDLRLLWTRDVTDEEWRATVGELVTPATAAQMAANGWCECEGYSAMPHLHETVAERDARVDAWEAEHGHCQQGGRGAIWECRRCGWTYDDDAYRLAMRAQLEAHVTT